MKRQQSNKWIKDYNFPSYYKNYPDGQEGYINYYPTNPRYALFLYDPKQTKISVDLDINNNLFPKFNYDYKSSFVGYRETLECAQLVIDLKVNPVRF